jgi:hypothetical protein
VPKSPDESETAMLPKCGEIGNWEILNGQIPARQFRTNRRARDRATRAHNPPAATSDVLAAIDDLDSTATPTSGRVR